jgi:hypothetical protein
MDSDNSVAYTALIGGGSDAVASDRSAEPIPQTPSSGRDEQGRFTAGHPGPRLAHGQYSQLVRSGAATGQQDALAASRFELRVELGDVGVVKGSLADAFVELSAVRDYLGGRLATEGPLTGKGRTRALLTAYLAVVDRQVRLAQVLGVERHRPVDPLDAVRRAVAAANENTKPGQERT